MNTPLKWVGSKTRIMETLKQHLPAGRRLVEPFAGSCAVILNTDYDEYLIGDVNPHLINFYQQVKDNPEALIEMAAPPFAFTNLESYYYTARAALNESNLPPLKQAAIFLFLNRHCYGGVCRYNLKGKFNTPYGHYKKAYFPENEIRVLSRCLARVTLICGDFSTTLAHVRQGDVVYCDPPYIPASATADFTGYHTDKFGAEQHRRLVTALLDLSESQIPVVLSNSDTPLTRDLLGGKFQIHALRAPRSIGNRKKATCTAAEVIAVRNLSGQYTSLNAAALTLIDPALGRDYSMQVTAERDPATSGIKVLSTEKVCNGCGRSGGGYCPDCGPCCGDATYKVMFEGCDEN